LIHSIDSLERRFFFSSPSWMGWQVFLAVRMSHGTSVGMMEQSLFRISLDSKIGFWCCNNGWVIFLQEWTNATFITFCLILYSISNLNWWKFEENFENCKAFNSDDKLFLNLWSGNFLFIKGTLFLAWNHLLFFGNLESKVIWSCQGSNPEPSDSHPDAKANSHNGPILLIVSRLTTVVLQHREWSLSSFWILVFLILS